MRRVKIYSDGGMFKTNPGPGGWGAVVILESGAYQVLSGASEEPMTTNNVMEVTAALKALEALPCPCDVTLVSDSQYLVKGMSSWRQGWESKGWVGVKNYELWQRLISAASRHRVEWKWVRGHNGDHFNEMADRAAGEAARTKWGQQ